MPTYIIIRQQAGSSLAFEGLTANILKLQYAKILQRHTESYKQTSI